MSMLIKHLKRSARFLPLLLLLAGFTLVTACSNKPSPTPMPPTATLTTQPSATSTHKPSSTPTLLPTETSTAEPDIPEYDYSSLPGWIAFVDYKCEIFCSNISIVKPDFTRYQTLTDHSHGFVMSMIHWSPDNRYIAYTFLATGENGGKQLRIFDTRSGKMDILLSGADVDTISWSPDNQYITVGIADGAIKTINVQTKSVKNLAQNSSLRSIYVAWSPDGKTIAYSANYHQDPSSMPGLWVISSTDGQDLFSEAKGFFPAWSPDGKKLAYYCTEGTGITDICMSNPDGSSLEHVIQLERSYYFEPLVWSPDSQHIAFITGKSEDLTDINVITFKNNEGVQLKKKSSSYTNVSWSPDSKALVYMDKEDFLYLNIFTPEGVYGVDSKAALQNPVWSGFSE